MWRASSGEHRPCWSSADPPTAAASSGPAPHTRVHVCTGASHTHAPLPSGAGGWGSAPQATQGPSAFNDLLTQVPLGFGTAPPDLPGAPLGSRDGLELRGVSVLGRWLTRTPGDPAWAGGTASAPQVQPRGCRPRACSQDGRAEALCPRAAGGAPRGRGVIGATPGSRPRGQGRRGQLRSPHWLGAGAGASETGTATAPRSRASSRKSHRHTHWRGGESPAVPTPRLLTAGPSWGALSSATGSC